MKHARLPLLPLPDPVSHTPAVRMTERRPVFFPLSHGEPFDLHHTFRCGQLFRWNLHGNTWYGPYGGGSLAVRAVPDGLEVRSAGIEPSQAEVAAFLGLHVSLDEVYRRLQGDRWVHAAIQAVPGMRLLRQDPWECLINFICSQNSNIPKIERSTERLSREWGTVHHWDDGIEVASLPSPEVLAELPAETLKICGLGYRCRYLVGSARLIATGAVPLGSLRALAYPDALKALLRLPGIGRKVADCILLFSLDQPQACPVDVWVRRVIHELYPQSLRRYLPDATERIDKTLSAREYDAIVRFAEDRWGRLAGHAQQYLFHARRHRLIGPDASPANNKALLPQPPLIPDPGLSDPGRER